MTPPHQLALRVAHLQTLNRVEPDRDLRDKLLLLCNLLLADAHELGLAWLGREGVELPGKAEAAQAASALGLEVVDQGRGGEGRERGVVATARGERKTGQDRGRARMK